MDINDMIDEQTYKALSNVVEGEERTDGIHVSDLKSNCLRKSYYHKVKESQYDLDGMLKMAFGKLVHKFELAPNSEHEKLFEEWNGIHGTPDDVWNGVVIDKKTTRNVPNKVRVHDRRQLEMYSAILDDYGYDIIGCAVIYIDMGRNPKIDVKSFPLDNVDFDDIREEMLDKKSTLEMHLEIGEPPERNVGWICNYCNFTKFCFFDDVEEDDK